MSAPDDGGPAFPLPFILDSTRGASGMYVDAADAGAPTGLSMRDYFAAKAMQAFVADDDPYKLCGDMIEERLKAAARYSYQMADAMLAAREVES